MATLSSGVRLLQTKTPIASGDEEEMEISPPEDLEEEQDEEDEGDLEDDGGLEEQEEEDDNSSNYEPKVNNLLKRSNKIL